MGIGENWVLAFYDAASGLLLGSEQLEVASGCTLGRLDYERRKAALTMGEDVSVYLVEGLRPPLVCGA